MMENIYGFWVVDKSDSDTVAIYGDASMLFNPDGTLIYSVLEGNKINSSFLTYRVEGSTLITNQKSSPREEKTEFFLDVDKLILYFGGMKSVFVKSEST